LMCTLVHAAGLIKSHHAGRTQPCLVLAARMVPRSSLMWVPERENVCLLVDGLVLAHTLPHLPSLSLLMLLQRRGQGPARAVRTD